MSLISVAFPALLLAGCAASPLWVEGGRGLTGVEVPRDGQGEPIFERIRPAPALAREPAGPALGGPACPPAAPRADALPSSAAAPRGGG